MTQTKRGMGQQAPSGFNNTEHNCNKKPRGLRKGCGSRTFAKCADGKYRFTRFRCKSYTCGRCGPRKIKQVRKKITALAVEHKLTRFLTLTLDPKKIPVGADERDKIAYLQGVWRKMRVSVSRRFGRGFKFIAVVEQQGNGNPHLHLLVGSYLPKEWISCAWQAVGGGWATRIEYANLQRVAAYLSKYITDESVCNLPTGTRRFSTSRGLAIFDRSKGGAVCLLLKTTVEEVLSRAAGVREERYETDANGARTIASFVAESVDRLDPTAFQRSAMSVGALKERR